MTKHPVIGISTYRQPADWASWVNTPADLLPSAYAESESAAGGVPVLVPPLTSAANAQTLAPHLDGLILAGGADINPALYKQRPHKNVPTWYDDRDASELWLLDAAQAAALPLLGICRGMQMMAVHAGGTLIQHLPDFVGNANHSGDGNRYGSNEIIIEPGHRISNLIDSVPLIACHHHQSVASHPRFIETAHANDGALEAMEAEGTRFEIAVQWHPETTADIGLFSGLVAAAVAYACAGSTA